MRLWQKFALPDAWNDLVIADASENMHVTAVSGLVLGRARLQEFFLHNLRLRSQSPPHPLPPKAASSELTARDGELLSVDDELHIVREELLRPLAPFAANLFPLLFVNC